MADKPTVGKCFFDGKIGMVVPVKAPKDIMGGGTVWVHKTHMKRIDEFWKAMRNYRGP